MMPAAEKADPAARSAAPAGCVGREFPGVNLEIITIGDEVLRFETREDNARFISESLMAIGLEPSRITVLPDDHGTIASELSRAMGRSDGVIVTGGLGPTVDDITRQAAIEALGGETDRLGGIVESAEKLFARLGRRMPEAYRDLERVPAGARALPNGVGVAPGIYVERGGSELWLLPGVPAEMRNIFEGSVLPMLEKRRSEGRTVIRLFGLSETDAERIMRDSVGEGRMKGVSIIAGPSGVNLYLRPGSIPADAMNELRRRFGSFIYTCGAGSIEEQVICIAAKAGLTISTAESVTGGLLASTLVSVPGASGAFIEGFVTYGNGAKSESLGVDPSLIEREGAVSGAVCLAMARGARERSGSDIAVSTTGIAGPGGGSADKPAGLCYVALAAEGGAYCRMMLFSGDRGMVRTRAVYTALDTLRLFLIGERERLEPFRAAEDAQ